MAKTDIPLYLKLYNFVVNEIKEGKLKSGDRVPSEKELAALFNVSRITSKKALERLEQASLIERMRGKGSFVSMALPDFSEIAAEDSKEDLADEDTNWGLLGLIVPDFSATYGLDLVKAIETRCAELKYHLILKQTLG